MKNKPTPRVTLAQNEAAPVSREVLAEAIVKLSDAAVALRNGGLNQRAVVVLLADKTKLSKQTVKVVVDAIAQLRLDYTTR